MKTLYFEDLEMGQIWVSPDYRVTRDEMIEFAERWDPQPYHLDDEAGAPSLFGTLIASASHIFAIHAHLIEKLEARIDLIAGLGVPRFELPHPVRPGDRLRLVRRVLSKRLSESKLDTGLVTTEQLLKNQNDQIVLETRHNMMVGCRPD